ERNVTISVTVSHDGDTPVTKDVVVKVLRDTDGDGTPDKTDNDDDGDGINDDQDDTPKTPTALDFTVGTPADAKEKAAYTSAVVVTPNKPNSTITSQPVNGLRVDETGKVVGTPEINNWGDTEEERNVTISVTVSHDGDTPVTKDVVVKV
ncbi:hypothetical protein OLE78_10555, partial [Streptococcus pneumoniae]|nr:hypothetical protein [Streptococcus pneumoniae]